MNDEPPIPSADDVDLEREIRQGRAFSLAEAIGRLAGPGAIKGASPISRPRQAQAQIEDALNRHLNDSAGALRLVLLRDCSQSAALFEQADQPLIAMVTHLRLILASDARLSELVRQADVEWGRMLGERPMFETDGSSPHPDDPYTVASVRTTLHHLLSGFEL